MKILDESKHAGKEDLRLHCNSYTSTIILFLILDSLSGKVGCCTLHRIAFVLVLEGIGEKKNLLFIIIVLNIRLLIQVLVKEADDYRASYLTCLRLNNLY